jgi:nicotinate-nucleotide adenylyltransferase
MDKSDNSAELQSIGLFGGSFDPIHMGHIKMALTAIDQYGLEKVFFITAKSSPFKLTVTKLDAQKRHELVELALQNYSNLYASKLELEREGEVSYSSDTIQEFKTLFPNARLFWIIGEDAFSRLEEWKDYQWIIQNIEFLVFRREQESADLIQSYKKDTRFYLIDSFAEEISSSELRNSIQENKMIDEPLKPYICPGTLDLLLKYYQY